MGAWRAAGACQRWKHNRTPPSKKPPQATVRARAAHLPVAALLGLEAKGRERAVEGAGARDAAGKQVARVGQQVGGHEGACAQQAAVGACFSGRKLFKEPALAGAPTIPPAAPRVPPSRPACPLASLTVRVAAHRDACRVGHPPPLQLLHRGAGAVGELLDVGVVGLLLALRRQAGRAGLGWLRGVVVVLCVGGWG